MKVLSGFKTLHQPRLRIRIEHPKRIRQPGAVGQQMVDRNDAVLCLNRKPWQIFENGPVQVELPFLLQLKNGQRDKRLGDRSNLKHVLGRERRLGFDIGEAKSGSANRTAGIGQAQRQTGSIHRLHVVGDKCIELLKLASRWGVSTERFTTRQRGQRGAGRRPA
jgi:hypothetical protein